MLIWLPLITAFLLLTAALLLIIHFFREVWTAESRWHPIAKNVSVSVFSLFYTFLILDGIFGIVAVQSDGFGFTLASRRWFQANWHPINEDGYRDYEHDWQEDIVFVVGDSFIAGHGIDDVEDRLANVLAKMIGDSWTVAVLAKNGWDPAREYHALVEHSQTPQKIVVSYYINDIESAAVSNGFPRPTLIEQPPLIIRPFVNNSFILNWFYWRQNRTAAIGDSYWDYLQQAYDNDAIWQTHQAELRAFIDHADEIDADIVFLVWPNLNDVDGSSIFTARVVDYLQAQDAAVIDLQTYFQGRSPESLIVNPLDGHPNVATNKEVAELVFASLFPQE